MSLDSIKWIVNALAYSYRLSDCYLVFPSGHGTGDDAGRCDQGAYAAYV